MLPPTHGCIGPLKIQAAYLSDALAVHRSTKQDDATRSWEEIFIDQ